MVLLHTIRQAQSALVAITSPEGQAAPNRESLEQFLSQLPDLWRLGEVRPTHAQRDARPRTWRTRKDPFEGVWSDVLLWLQQEPDATAKKSQPWTDDPAQANRKLAGAGAWLGLQGLLRHGSTATALLQPNDEAHSAMSYAGIVVEMLPGRPSVVCTESEVRYSGSYARRQ